MKSYRLAIPAGQFVIIEDNGRYTCTSWFDDEEDEDLLNFTQDAVLDKKTDTLVIGSSWVVRSETRNQGMISHLFDSLPRWNKSKHLLTLFQRGDFNLTYCKSGGRVKRKAQEILENIPKEVIEQVKENCPCDGCEGMCDPRCAEALGR